MHQCPGNMSDMRLCIMPGLPTHLVQELNVRTVASILFTDTMVGIGRSYWNCCELHKLDSWFTSS